jgi:hypothetical protein
MFWPQAQAAPPKEKRTSVYGGVEHQTRKADARPSDAVFVLAGSAQPVPAAPQTASPVLVGIAERSVYLKAASSGETVRVSIGETLDGWKVAAVRGRTITLEGPGGRREMSLFEKPASVTPGSSGWTTENGGPVPPASSPPHGG